ncbi:hypothetical protein [Sphingosinithalassobacter sp. CS137]|uniref:hypothetical protein n=1 Tax=Sphingosinithalassobacter sp. CS137 TaxID=2762748 RepID=UPI00165D67F6|nr:hypothetical protein [Sphingosinithalassobacter sp. CS137]
MIRLPFLIAALLMLAPLPVAAQECDERCLLDITGTYLDALSANDPASVPFAASLKATENGVAVPPGEGVWSTATAWPYRHTMVDPTTGEIVVLGVVNEGRETEGEPRDAFLVVRLKVAGRQIIESELMVAREGDFPLFRPRAFNIPDPLFRAFVPAERQSTREELEAIARGYFDGIIFGDPGRTVLHPDCNRFENGYQTTNNPDRLSMSCAEGLRRLRYMHSYRDVRIPVVDTDRGLVLAITAFDMPDVERTLTIRGRPHQITRERQRLPRTLFLYELFKVIDGRIVLIEAMMRNMPYGADMGWGGAEGNVNETP